MARGMISTMVVVGQYCAGCFGNMRARIKSGSGIGNNVTVKLFEISGLLNIPIICTGSYWDNHVFWPIILTLSGRWPFINVSKVLLHATGDSRKQHRHHSDHPSHYVSPVTQDWTQINIWHVTHSTTVAKPFSVAFFWQSPTIQIYEI